LRDIKHDPVISKMRIYCDNLNREKTTLTNPNNINIYHRRNPYGYKTKLQKHIKSDSIKKDQKGSKLSE
jgi:hypothetical protein